MKVEVLYNVLRSERTGQPYGKAAKIFRALDLFRPVEFRLRLPYSVAAWQAAR